MKECIDLERQVRGGGISRCDLFFEAKMQTRRTYADKAGGFGLLLAPALSTMADLSVKSDPLDIVNLQGPAVQKQWLSFGLGVLVLGACTQTPQSAYHVPVPPAPKTSQVLSNPQGARIAVNQEYLGEVIKFPAETESGNYTLEETLLGFGNAIVKAITGQQSNEDPHQTH
jgi:hypothetical protein